MPPATKQRPVVTPEGAAAAGRIKEFRQNINNGATPKEARATVRELSAGPVTPPLTPPTTGLNPTLPKTIPSTTLQSDQTIGDVFARRNEMQAQNDQKTQLNTDYETLTGKIGNLKPNPLTNPDESINRILANQPTEVGNALNQGYQDAADRFNSFSQSYSDAGSQAREDLNVTGIQKELSLTNKDIADETLRLRKVMRDFEINAERRGVAREFIESEKLAIKTKSAELLADLNITRLAQQGDLKLANEEVDRILAEKEKAFGFETKAIEQEIARLEKLDTKEADARKDELTVALSERANNVAKALAEEKESRSYYVDAANNGADKATLDTMRNMIQNGVDPVEVAFAGSAYIGLLDRQVKQANIAQSYASANASRLSAQKTQAEINAINSTATGESNTAVQALDAFSGTLDENKREQYTRAVTNAVKRGNVEQTEIALKTAAQVVGGAALRDDVIKVDQAITALKSVQKAIDEYEKAGGKTGLLTGGYEQLQNKLGKTSDPKLAAIETRINLALNSYTNAVSGASFTPQESARYESLFPKTSNQSVLNSTKIDTLVDSFDEKNQAFYGNYFGGYTPSQIAEQAVYEELVANATPEQLKELGITQ